MTSNKIKEIVCYDIFQDFCQHNYGFDSEILGKIEANILRICAENSKGNELILSQETVSGDSVYHDATGESPISRSSISEKSKTPQKTNEIEMDTVDSDKEDNSGVLDSSTTLTDQTVIHNDPSKDIIANQNEIDDEEMDINDEDNFSQNQPVFTSTQRLLDSPNIFCEKNARLSLSFETLTPTKTLTPQLQEADSSQHLDSNQDVPKTFTKVSKLVLKFENEFGPFYIADTGIVEDTKLGLITDYGPILVADVD